MIKSYIPVIAGAFALVLASGQSEAQLSLSQMGTTATMDFDIPGTPDCNAGVTWTNNVTIPNCYTDKSVYYYSDGCSNVGAVHVAGASGETAFGGRASTSTSLIRWGVRVVNNTGQAITMLHIKYRAEQWAEAQSNVTNTITFGYQVSASPITDVTTGTYTSVPSLNMTNFTTWPGGCTGSGRAAKGNDGDHSAVIAACIQVNIPAGHEIMLRWYEPNDNCNDHMMCVDDLEVTPLSGVTAAVSNAPVCAGDTLKLTARPLVAGATYAWTGPGSFTASKADTAIAPAAAAHAGTYQVTMSVPGCGTWSDDVNVTIAPPVTDTVYDSICSGQSYSFDGKTYTTAGTYTATYKSAGGCDSVLVLLLSVKATPAAPAVTDTIHYCQFETADTLTADGAALIWYTTAAGGAGSDIAPVPATDTPGIVTYYVSKVVDGCESGRAAITIVVYPSFAQFTVQPSPICAGDTALITFTGDASPTSVFNWDWNGGIVCGGGGQGPYHVSWPEPGYKDIRLQVDNQGCLSEIDSVQLLVRALPEASLTVPDAVCPDVQVTMRSSGGQPYRWYYEDGIPAGEMSGETILMRWPVSGDKHVGVAVVDRYGCISPVSYKTIEVYRQPEARIIGRPEAAVCVNDTARLEAAYHEQYRYSWTPGYLLSGATQEPVVLAKMQDRTAAIHVTVTDENGCSAADTAWVPVAPCCDVFLPNAFTPNGDGKNDIYKAIAKGPQQAFDFRIFNRWGNLVFMTSKDKEGWDGTCNGQPAELGSYYYILRYDCAGEGRILKGAVMLVR